MTDHLATALPDEQRRHRYVAEGVPQIECLCGWTSSRVEPDGSQTAVVIAIRRAS
ncbi:MAG: hypothetical protein E7E98_08340 [Cutibacterium avidum]|nr:hypothetical protein [Cutibacterium avidum]